MSQIKNIKDHIILIKLNTQNQFQMIQILKNIQDQFQKNSIQTEYSKSISNDSQDYTGMTNPHEYTRVESSKNLKANFNPKSEYQRTNSKNSIQGQMLDSQNEYTRPNSNNIYDSSMKVPMNDSTDSYSQNEYTRPTNEYSKPPPNMYHQNEYSSSVPNESENYTRMPTPKKPFQN